MKKNLLAVLFIIALAGARTNAQNPIPNYSFENWTGGDPDLWSTDNSGYATFVTQVSPGHSGASAARGDVASVLGFPAPPQMYSIDPANGTSGFAVSQMYSTFYMYYKFNQVGSGEILIGLDFYNSSDSIIGYGVGLITTPATNFTLLSVPITWTGVSPVSCIISLFIGDPNAGFPALGNYFIIDDLSFDNPIGVPSIVSKNYFMESPSPNPAATSATISFTIPNPAEVDLKIYNMLGQEVKLIHAGNTISGKNCMNIDVSDLSAGTYVLEMSSEFGMLQRRLVVSK